MASISSLAISPASAIACQGVGPVAQFGGGDLQRRQVGDTVAVHDHDAAKTVDHQALADIQGHRRQGLGPEGEGTRKAQVVRRPADMERRHGQGARPRRSTLGGGDGPAGVGQKGQMQAVLFGCPDRHQRDVVILQVGLDVRPGQLVQPAGGGGGHGDSYAAGKVSFQRGYYVMSLGKS